MPKTDDQYEGVIDSRQREAPEELIEQLNNRIKLEEIVRKSSISLLNFEGSLDDKIENSWVFNCKSAEQVIFSFFLKITIL